MDACKNKKSSIVPKNFRNDINGLRAIAVAAVVLYHFGVTGFSGGFVGVDIFFVISGFLMTRIIISGMERGDFSLRDFYLARAKRIIPALLALCTVLIVLGWFFLATSDYRQLGLHAASALFFVSNFRFWKEAGYFDAGSHEKWLLHTWSLSVEWQFYILLPLGVLLVWHWFGKRGVKWALCAIGVLSFALSIYASSRWPGMAFYLLPTRAWEMLAGGMVWWLTRNPRISGGAARIVEVLGLLLIVWSVVMFDSNMLWPSGYAAIPVLGTMLVLLAARQDSLVTGNLVAQRLGESSYSIYLWHWPIVVILNYAGEIHNPYWIVAGLIVTLIVGELSLKFVEVPARMRLGLLTKKRFYTEVCAPLFLVVVTASSVYLSSGANYSWRQGASSKMSEYIDSYDKSVYLSDDVKREYRLECDFFDGDKYTAKNHSISSGCTSSVAVGGSVFLWGDSHAQALSYGLRQHLKSNVAFNQVTSSGCQPHVGGDSVSSGQFKVSCDRSNAFALEKIKELKPDLVIMAQRFGHDKNNYDVIVSELERIGAKKIIIVGPVPQWMPSLPRAIGIRHFDSKEIYIKDNSLDKAGLKTNDVMRNKFSGDDRVSYISVIDALCKGDECLSKVDDKNTPLVWDYGHLSLAGSKFVVSKVLMKNTTFSDWFH